MGAEQSQDQLFDFDEENVEPFSELDFYIPDDDLTHQNQTPLPNSFSTTNNEEPINNVTNQSTGPPTEQLVNQQMNLPNSGRKRLQKKKIHLTPRQFELKRRIYSTFGKNVYPKKYLITIFRTILIPQLSLETITRKDQRQKDYIFIHYEQYANQILKCLEKNKDFINEEILKDYFEERKEKINENRKEKTEKKKR